jgi:hypothetical protein
MRYYFGVAVVFFVLAGVLPFVWMQFLWYFALVLGSLIQVASSGPASWLLAIGLYAGAVMVFVFLITLAKNRLFGHHHMDTMPA